MPSKQVQLTLEVLVDAVTCPGVWLCPEGEVSLAVFALGSSHHTARVQPIFPLIYKDIFYFRKKFRNACSLSNLECALRGETIYCELIQWRCACEPSVLAQYLGCLSDVLFPPDTCASDGIDLLMRATSTFPGILAPKVEISTKVRVDEVYEDQAHQSSHQQPPLVPPVGASSAEHDFRRQKPVCHSRMYHRSRCSSGRQSPNKRGKGTQVSSYDMGRDSSNPRSADESIQTTSVNKCTCKPNYASTSKPKSNKLRSGVHNAYHLKAHYEIQGSEIQKDPVLREIYWKQMREQSDNYLSPNSKKMYQNGLPARRKYRNDPTVSLASTRSYSCSKQSSRSPNSSINTISPRSSNGKALSPRATSPRESLSRTSSPRRPRQRRSSVLFGTATLRLPIVLFPGTRSPSPTRTIVRTPQSSQGINTQHSKPVTSMCAQVCMDGSRLKCSGSLGVIGDNVGQFNSRVAHILESDSIDSRRSKMRVEDMRGKAEVVGTQSRTHTQKDVCVCEICHRYHQLFH